MIKIIIFLFVFKKMLYSSTIFRPDTMATIVIKWKRVDTGGIQCLGHEFMKSAFVYKYWKSSACDSHQRFSQLSFRDRSTNLEPNATAKDNPLTKEELKLITLLIVFGKIKNLCETYKRIRDSRGAATEKKTF